MRNADNLLHYSGLKLHHSPLEDQPFPDVIKAEPMFFRADLDFARREGGLLTHEFLREAEEIWGDISNVIIDSRHHMLMPGMYPCIPGWHTDDAPRSPAYCGGQPNIFTPHYETEHLLCVVDCGTESLTEFLVGDVELSRRYIERKWAEDGANFYKTADRLLDTYAPGERIQVKSGQIAEFNVHSWHRGMPAKHRGFRWFIRMTRYSKHKVENEIRSNAQVYLTDAAYGW
ncbi:hypothetical protein [Cupriavidus nantongensis]|uniref:Phytanoyl-CoA dioxygenase n=1 Tax=Cupriavidus nantongensis TaxID=1796606 RepID=A0A142JMX2_9BURK|nr:hypothetical protein [Cupriavidus nantongensis]AMR79434.1 hypothetical protein A2G96_17750 [Cupriavidus nantongensis]